MAKVPFPRCPDGGYIAGWYVAEGADSVRAQVEDGTCSSKEMKKLVKYVTQLAAWVGQEEKKLSKGA